MSEKTRESVLGKRNEQAMTVSEVKARMREIALSKRPQR